MSKIHFDIFVSYLFLINNRNNEKKKLIPNICSKDLSCNRVRIIASIYDKMTKKSYFLVLFFICHSSQNPIYDIPVSSVNCKRLKSNLSE